MRITLLLLMITCLVSCHTYDTVTGNPYYQGCTIKGGFENQNKYDFTEHLKNIKNEINTRLNLTENLNEIFLTEVFDGGDGIHELKVILFNEQKIIPISIDYTSKSGESFTTRFTTKKASKSQHKKLIKHFKRIKNNSGWSICINCFSLTNEQELVFYLKDQNKYHYFAQFKNFYFTKSPSLGIDKDVLEIIKVMESI